MTTREDLYRLIDELPESELDAARHWLEHRRPGEDLLLQVLLNAPEDDEPTTPEEDAGAAEAMEEYRRGEFISAEQAKRELLP